MTESPWLKPVPEADAAGDAHAHTASLYQQAIADVILLWLEGLEAADIGEVVGLSPDNVAQKVHRTRKVLQRQFETGGTP